jgi:hypothetical protein
LPARLDLVARVAEEEIKNLESVLTIVGGKPVYAAEEFAELAPPIPPVLPEWSPVAAYGGYFKPATSPAMACSSLELAHRSEHRCHDSRNARDNFEFERRLRFLRKSGAH